MSRSINSLLAEADVLIEKHASAGQQAPAEDDVFKLAADLTKDEPEPQEHQDWSVLEKIAWAQAITDTVNNLGHIKKLTEFEKKANEKGFPREKISAYINKYAQENYVTTIPKILSQ